MIGDFRRPHTWTVKFDDGETRECRSLLKLLWTMRPTVIPWSLRRRWYTFTANMTSEDTCDACGKREWPWRKMRVVPDVPVPGIKWHHLACSEKCRRQVVVDIIGKMTLEQLEAMTDDQFAHLLDVEH